MYPEYQEQVKLTMAVFEMFLRRECVATLCRETDAELKQYNRPAQRNNLGIRH